MGKLVCALHGETLKLQQFVQQAARGAEPDPLLAICGMDPAEPPLHVLAMHMPGGAFPGGRGGTEGDCRVLLMLVQSGSDFTVSSRVLEKVLKLSPAEARLAKAIVEGGSVGGYAEQRGLSEGTVRFQLKQVLAKTDCPRQSDLVRLVCSSLLGEFRA